MTNSERNIKFLAVIDDNTRADILGNIAQHYGVTQVDARWEVEGPDAESILDYLTGPVRTAASLLMKRHGLA